MHFLKLKSTDSRATGATSSKPSDPLGIAHLRAGPENVSKADRKKIIKMLKGWAGTGDPLRTAVATIIARAVKKGDREVTVDYGRDLPPIEDWGIVVKRSSLASRQSTDLQRDAANPPGKSNLLSPMSPDLALSLSALDNDSCLAATQKFVADIGASRNDNRSVESILNWSTALIERVGDPGNPRDLRSTNRANREALSTMLKKSVIPALAGMNPTDAQLKTDQEQAIKDLDGWAVWASSSVDTTPTSSSPLQFDRLVELADKLIDRIVEIGQPGNHVERINELSTSSESLEKLIAEMKRTGPQFQDEAQWRNEKIENVEGWLNLAKSRLATSPD